MEKQIVINEINVSRRFLLNSIAPLTEADSDFVPVKGMMSVAQQVAHIARTVDWFVDGAESPNGFNMDFERHTAEAMAITSLQKALDWLDSAFEDAVKFVAGTDVAWLDSPLPEGPVMGGLPRGAALLAIVDHTAHHRGALSVYTRLCGKVPPMPYLDADEG